MRISGRRRLAAVTAIGAVMLSACGTTTKDGPEDVLADLQSRQQAAAHASSAAASSSAGTGTTAAAAGCSPAANASYAPLGSLPAPGSMLAGSLEATIAKRGYIVVGVSGDTRLLGARNSLQGGVLEGFDIQMARAIATAIFGSSTSANTRFKVITAAQRGPLVNAGVEKNGVDLVARAMTMTCDRWKTMAFSAVYFNAEQIMLSHSANVTSAELAKDKAKVCAPTGSTSLDKIKTIAGIQPVAVDIHSDCLALFQEGRVDAITGDDAILAGFKDQDPRAKLGTEKLGAQPYGMAIAQAHPEFARFVNAVLASPAGRAAWTTAYADSGLQAALGAKTQPAPVYGR